MSNNSIKNREYEEDGSSYNCLLNDFKSYFAKYLSDPDRDGESKSFMFYANYDDYVYSLSIEAKLDIEKSKNGEDIYLINNVCWQEEDLGSSLHNVCSNSWRTYCPEYVKDLPNFAVYNFTQDVLSQDVYLGDKYGDCSDGWFSDRIEYLFNKYPKYQCLII